MAEQYPIKVLIIDDEELMRQIVGSAVIALGAEVVGEASNGMEGVAKFTELTPDLVLLDIRMPEVGGLETLKALREKADDVYVVMLTAVRDQALVSECAIAGAKDYITKDMPTGDMIQRLQRHMKRLSGEPKTA